jgi:hypothetical protein
MSARLLGRLFASAFALAALFGAVAVAGETGLATTFTYEWVADFGATNVSGVADAVDTFASAGSGV